MIAFVVSVNAQPITVAGESAACVLTAILTAAGRLGPDSLGTRVDPDGVSITLEVGGLARRQGEEVSEHLHWSHRTLGAGDEIHVRIVEVAQADPPARAEPVVDDADPTADDELRREFEEARDTYLALRYRFEPQGK